MGTRAAITARLKAGYYKTVYCHYDGYPEWTGVTLRDHYNTVEDVEELFRYGDMSFLDVSTECPRGHSFEKKVRGYTVFYGRDRGETGVNGAIGATAEESLKAFGKRCQEWEYLWEGEQWMCRPATFNQEEEPKEYRTLAEVIGEV